jgi:glycosyltransferase involved in cell wall biosynthesis
MEAAAMGKPVVATNIRGCRQAVDHGVTGLLVPVRDPGALAGAIETLARDAELRRRFGAAAREKAQRDFDDRRCVQITLDTYERLLARRAPTATPTP